MVKKILLGTLVGFAMGFMVGGAMLGLPGAIIGGGFGLALAGTIMTALAIGGGLSSRYPRSIRHAAFQCRHSRRPVEAVLLHSADTDSIFDVQACSVFSPPSDVRCKKRCVADLNDGTATPIA